ncbi:MAG: DoxX family protein [Candidatus Neomarinimicrobiota bacterium]
MTKFPTSALSRFEPQVYALLRIVTGFLFLWHGTNKVFGFPVAGSAAPWPITWVAGPIELIGGLLVMLGFFTRPAAFLSAGLMAVAYWWKHGLNDLLPIMNRGELAVLYCFLFLFIFVRGAGIFSLDQRRC